MKILNNFQRETILFLAKIGLLSITISLLILEALLYYLKMDFSYSEKLPILIFILTLVTISSMVISLQGRKLRSKEEQLAAVLESTNQAIFILDERKNVISSNRAGTEILNIQDGHSFNFCERCTNFSDVGKKCVSPHCFLDKDVESLMNLYLKSGNGQTISGLANIAYYLTAEKQKGTVICFQKFNETEVKDNWEMERLITQSIFQAQEKEKILLSRELNDGIGQSLFGILFHTDILKTLIRQESLQKHLEKLQGMIQQTMDDVNKLSSELRPASLDDHGLIVTLKNFIRHLHTRYAMQINFTYKGKNERIDPSIETALYRIAQEALVNAGKYSCAERVDVLIDRETNRNEVYLSVKDFGKGFELNSTNRKGIGMYFMEKRALILGGKFNVVSEIGNGTKIEVSVPLRHD